MKTPTRSALTAALAFATKCSRTAPTEKGRVWWLLQAADFAARLEALG